MEAKDEVKQTERKNVFEMGGTKMNMDRKHGKHSGYNTCGTNVFHESFINGDDCQIGDFCIIEEDCIIGNNVKIENYVLLKKGTVIGDNCYIDSYSRSSGDNEIGNNVTVRFGATIARKVFVRNDVFISPNVMTVYSLPDGSKSSATVIGARAFIGTAAVLAPNIVIKAGAVVGANSFVNKSILEKGIYAGNPAKKIRDL